MPTFLSVHVNADGQACPSHECGDGRRSRLQNAIDGAGDRAFWDLPDDFFLRLAAGEHEDARNAVDAVLGRQILRVVDVQLADLDFADVFGGNAVDGRRQGAAGTAPWRPEIDDDRYLAVDHFGLPVIAGEFQHIRACHARVLSSKSQITGSRFIIRMSVKPSNVVRLDVPRTAL